MATLPFDVLSFFDAFQEDDPIGDAAVRALGIDPTTNQWISPVYDNGQDPVQLAAAARAKAHADNAKDTAVLSTMLQAQHEAAGGTLADFLNPFSANVDPNSDTSKIANHLKNINWNAVILVILLFVVVIGIAEVKELL